LLTGLNATQAAKCSHLGRVFPARTVERVRGALAVAGLVLVAGCTAEEPRSEPDPPPGSPSTPTATGPSPAPPAPAPRVSPDDVRVATAVAAVRHLAGRVGPRPGTSPAYARAAAWVQRELTGLGWTVDRQEFPTPGGVSWGVPVRGGTGTNLVASRGDVVPGEPWLLVGAHLDTVPPAPGAEDNASGVGVLLAVAEALAASRSRLPVVLVAFGSEEPRGPSDADHHYGSRAYVEALSPAERRSLRGAVALDRVGVGDVVPLGSVEADDPLRDEVERAARRAGVPVVTSSGERSSDHASFVEVGLPGVRLGSTPYAGYHSAGDTVDVVQPAQLARTARVVLSWLR
jgi:aminopeptidase YwaD